PAAAPARSDAPAAPAAAAKTGRSGEIFAALGERLKADPKVANGLSGQVLQFNVLDPEAAWTVDFSGKLPKVAEGHAGKAGAVFGLADADLVGLAKGEAKARDLFQRGRLSVEGDVRLAHELGVLAKLI
ncbi:MAG: SCP2 sterol-binding domain-containing protein, partial [Nevskia sp.]|nr:SCP2 sterol-binding domain-containing protein [Nevskia sp.]